MVNLGIGCWWIPKIGAAGAVAGALAAEVCILASWIFLGTHHFRNLPLRWRRSWLTLGLTGGFVALYRAGFVFPQLIWGERFLVSLVILVLMGIPLLRRAWEHRGQFHP
jgi:hypothetical protein